LIHALHTSTRELKLHHSCSTCKVMRWSNNGFRGGVWIVSMVPQFLGNTCSMQTSRFDPYFFYYYLFLFWILFLIKFIFYFHPSSFIFLCQICFLFFYCYLFYFGKFVRFKYFFLISSFNIKLIGKWASWLNLNLGFHGLQIWKTNLVLRDLPKVA
jgi:hypothetical protein